MKSTRFDHLLLLIGVMIVNGALSAWEKRLHRRFGQR